METRPQVLLATSIGRAHQKWSVIARALATAGPQFAADCSVRTPYLANLSIGDIAS
jgi:hypothetical protein